MTPSALPPRPPTSDPRPLLRALRLIHPFPTALNAVAVVFLALVAERGSPGAWLLARLAVTMFFAQAAIGAVNDYVDRHLDAATKPWKPIAAGVVSPGKALRVGVVAAGASLAVGATLGPAALALSAAGMATGLVYDLRLKRTAYSGMTYAVALPLVPLWVWTALDRFSPVLLWVWPIGLLLGGALQIANALPDLEGDASQGVRGAAQRLGRRGALVTAWGGYLLAVVLALILGLGLGHDLRLLLPGVAAALALLAITVVAYAVRPGVAALQLGWSVLAPGAGVLAVSWLAGLQLP
jgi:4-hydroxybenzoate polyprenyltransferase